MSKETSGSRDDAEPENAEATSPESVGPESVGPAPESGAPKSGRPEPTPTTAAPPKVKESRTPTTSRLERFRSFFVEHYMRVDPRTAGLFRISLGVILTLDTIRHWSEAAMLYSRSGVLSNDYHLFRPTSGYQFSIFHAFSTVAEVHVCFALGVLCHLLMIVGFRSRLFAFLSFVFVTSMDSRIPFVENGGYIVVNLACLWAALLPTGQRFGIDAWRKSWRARRERTTGELVDRTDFAGERRPMVSLIGLIVTVNLAIVYFWNVENKGGAIWRAGNTVHYVLYINRMITGLAAWSRVIPEPLLRVVDWCVLVVEAHIAVFIASPIARRYTRPFAIILMIALHSTFGFMMRLGPFSWFLVACTPLLLTPIQWADLESWYRRRAGPTLVVVSSGSPLALALARILSRLDGYELLTFEARAVEGALLAIESVDGSLVQKPSEVLKAIARSLPLGRYFYPLFAITTLGAPARALSFLTRHASWATRFFGLDETDPFFPSRLDVHPSDLEPPSAPTGPAPRERPRKWFALACLIFVAFLALAHNLPDRFKLHQLVCDGDDNRFIGSISWGFFAVLFGVLILFWPRPRPWPLLLRDRLVRSRFFVRELFLAYYAVASLSQTYNENKGIPPVLKFNQPAFLNATLTYPRLFQGWGMFAPNPIQEDGVLVIDAYTIDGRRIDPYNGGAPDLDLTDDAGRGISQLRQDYGNRIRLDHNQEYRTELRNYLLSWHQLTGNPGDEIIAFDVYWVRAKCPPPGKSKLFQNDPVAIYTYRKQGLKPVPGGVPIPPSPKLRSAEKWEDDTATKAATTTK